MATPAVPSHQTLGRFELRRQLGKGAQSTVWLAFDPRLDREVVIKQMRSGSDSSAMTQWLQEARSVSRLNHPNIVPLFEADIHAEQLYLVFEYVEGKTLTEFLQTRGQLQSHEAVELMLGVIDALATAHAAGVVHRDLKPSNILIDTHGRGLVMDFGIAARVHEAAERQNVVGTPCYMSPEATHGLKPTPGMDIFSFGLVLAEAMFGEPLIAEKDAFHAMYRVAHEDLNLPDDNAFNVDDELRAIVLRCLARDPALRYSSAIEVRDALQLWLTPANLPAPAASGGAAATLEFLLRRMRYKSDFPALSDSVIRIQRVANSENESLTSLSSEILKDIALTNKLLRLVNSVHFAQSGGGEVSTVSRAVALVGFAGIRNMALNLVVLEHMHDKAHASQLKEEFLRSLMAGSLAYELCMAQPDKEGAFIGATFLNLGRLLTEFYFPEEARQIRALSTAKGPSDSDAKALDEQAASLSVLGLSFEDLGLGVAKVWNLPETLQRCMAVPKGSPPSRPCEKDERLRWITRAANDLTDSLLKAEPGQASARIADIAKRYTGVLEITPGEMQAAAMLAQQRLIELAKAMNLHMHPGSDLRRLLEQMGNGTAKNAQQDELAEHELHATMPDSPSVDGRPMFDQSAASVMLTNGIQDITSTMVEHFQLNEVLRMVLETMLRALGFRRVLFCLRDSKTNTMVARFGLGENVEAVTAKFKVSLQMSTGVSPDLFTAICLKGVDTLIADATVASVATRLPEWYRQSINAPAFLLLPLMRQETPFALIYADKAQPGGIDLTERELSLLRTLRNQAIMAFKLAN